MPQKAPHSFLLLALIALSISFFSCSTETESPYEQSYIEFKLDTSSPLGYDDLQSIKVFVDPYGAFNLVSIFDNGRSVLGSYDYNSETKLYMGFEYSPLYTCRLEDLSVSVTSEGSQNFIDSAEYTLQFMGGMPAESADKPYVQISVASGAVTLRAVQGAAGSPLLSITEQVDP
ncbi:MULTISPECIES: hypothetical protein [unclassified Oceanispirochaeta]|uniref:hypothetical protein n=1 Tax=unclassified Oceanispirochaeta TaxID=2635722 RepID=UPI000E09A586|nr:MULTISPECIES: hypothetical protein [unclassified Oceanispirochaeta]MBF9017795.1 hypothetical protein [Oceanispirochaeta sp. M2]NPD74359.1 hypothetical protein [Oceanispirochaeta sp. M1]RDG29838.1 hypothetical protein DV872_19850 [Oceanispirochaeta sp. M1]